MNETKMNSPRPSTSSEGTIIDRSSSYLLEEFPKPSLPTAHDTSPPPKIPLLYTPAYTKTHTRIKHMRIAAFTLNIVASPVAFFLSTPFPLQILTTFLTILPLLGSMIDALNTKEDIEKAMKGKLGGERERRTAVLVEDPVTGEEKWMLEKVPESQGVEGVLEARHWITGCDVWCVLVVGGSAVLGIVFGTRRENVGALVVVEVLKGVLLGLVVVGGWLRWSLIADGKQDDGEREY